MKSVTINLIILLTWKTGYLLTSKCYTTSSSCEQIVISLFAIHIVLNSFKTEGDEERIILERERANGCFVLKQGGFGKSELF